MPDLVYDLSPTEAAALLHVHVDTLKRWVKNGKLSAFRTPGGWLRFSRVDIDHFLATNATPLEHDPEAVA